MRVEFETLSDNYDRLHHKSQEIIHALQNERDTKILENEELKAQVCTCVSREGKEERRERWREEEREG